MHIGLTYDLRNEYLAEGWSEAETAEFDRDDTIEAIDIALRQIGHKTDRVGRLSKLVTRLARGDRWDLVFNIAEGMFGKAREAQVPALLDAYRIPYTFADPAVLMLSLDKALCKMAIQQVGLPTPPHWVIKTQADIDRVSPQFPLFCKPLAEGTGKGVTEDSLVGTRKALADQCRRLLAEFHQPVLVETYLPGREFTVGLLGTGMEAEVLGTLEIILLSSAERHAYSYLNKEFCEQYVEYRFVSAADPEVAQAEQIALAAWRWLGARDGGRVDLRSDENGQPQFLEINPLAGLHPQHSDLPMIATAVGMPYHELIGRIVDSATKRIGNPAIF